MVMFTQNTSTWEAEARIGAGSRLAFTLNRIRPKKKKKKKARKEKHKAKIICKVDGTVVECTLSFTQAPGSDLKHPNEKKNWQ